MSPSTISRFWLTNLSLLAHFEWTYSRTLVFSSAHYPMLIRLLSAVATGPRFEVLQSIVRAVTAVSSASPQRVPPLVAPAARAVVHRDAMVLRNRTMQGATILSLIRRDVLRLLEQYRENYSASTFESHHKSDEKHVLLHTRRESNERIHSLERILVNALHATRFLEAIITRTPPPAATTTVSEHPFAAVLFALIERTSVFRNDRVSDLRYPTTGHHTRELSTSTFSLRLATSLNAMPVRLVRRAVRVKRTFTIAEFLFLRAQSVESATDHLSLIYRTEASAPSRHTPVEAQRRIVEEEEFIKHVQRRIVEETTRVERKLKQQIGSTEDLTDQVYDRLTRRLQVERERLGY
jgi:hypothetical protein